MKYEWINEPKFETLSVSGEGDVLIYIAGDEKAELHLKGADIEKVVFTRGGEVHTISADQATRITVSDGNSKRDVFHFLKPKGPAPTMRLGITKHIGLGTWSSLPHPFELNPEAGFEEAFFYLLEGGSGRAIQRGHGVWCDNSQVDDVWKVRDRSFGAIPMGYHPVVGEPGVHVSYVWVYLAKKQEWEKI